MPVSDEATCPVCTGEGIELGWLGNRRHFRCRHCGMEFSRKIACPHPVTQCPECDPDAPGLGYMQGRGAS